MPSSPTPYVLWNVVSAAIRLSLTTPRICCSSRVRPPRSALRKQFRPRTAASFMGPLRFEATFPLECFLGVLMLSG
jgi:hypothetical protein